MTIRELLKTYPDRFVVKGKIWTDKRNTIDLTGSFDPLIGHLVTLLLCRAEPRSKDEREAIQALATMLTPNAADDDRNRPVHG